MSTAIVTVARHACAWCAAPIFRTGGERFVRCTHCLGLNVFGARGSDTPQAEAVSRGGRGHTFNLEHLTPQHSGAAAEQPGTTPASVEAGRLGVVAPACGARRRTANAWMGKPLIFADER